MEYINLVLSAVAVILGILILLKVNKISNDQHTPIVKRVSETGLKPNRHALSAQEMASRGNANRHEGERGNDRQRNGANGNNRGERGFNRDRGERRNNGRGERRNDRRREFNAEAPAAAQSVAPVAPQAPVEVAPAAPVQPAPTPVQAAPAVEAPKTEGRRPLPPRVQASLPEVPAAAPAPAAEAEPVGAEFEPSKVRYGRRNAIKKIPVEDEASESGEVQA